MDEDVDVRLTVSAPATGARAHVVVSAPAGTVLADVADALLAAVLPAPGTGALSVAGRPLPGSTLFGAPPLVHGALVEVDAPAGERSLDGGPQVLVVGGPSAGAAAPLRGDVVVGRAGTLALDDAAVSRRHCRLRLHGDAVTVVDVGSTNGTFVDGERIAVEVPLPEGVLLRVGDSALAVVQGVPATAPCTTSYDGTLRLNRPPRLRPSPATPRITVPSPPAGPERSPVPVLAVVAPLLLGIGMWRVLGSASFLLFTLLSPVLVIGNVVSDRRSGRRRLRRRQAEWQAERAAAEEALRAAVRADERARRDAAPDPARLLRIARGPSPRLWERRRADDDVLDLRLGLADQPARVEVVGEVQPGAAVARAVPVVVPVRSLGVVGVAGPAEQSRAVVRTLLASAVTLHSPRDLQVVVLAETAAADAWQWVRWLPHTSPQPGQRGAVTVGFTTEQVTARVAELTALVEARAAGPGASEHLVLVVVDGARALRSVRGLAALLADGPAVGVHAVAIDEDVHLLPAECAASVEVDEAGRARVRLPDRTLELAADQVSPSYAEDLARALAPLREHRVEQVDGLPSCVAWTDVAGLTLDGSSRDATRLLERWQDTAVTTVPLGRTADGVFTVDLAGDGPHALVAGTTGAGKSELLQALIASLVAANRPDRLQLVLVDYKGGAAFGPCRRLPHTVGMVTDLDGPLVERALESLTAELRRREHVLAAAGAKDIDDLDRGGGGDLARLVIVVDEFAALADELPEFVRGLVGIAQRGRSLGVHLVLATQRPEGVVSADIRANTNLRLCLAVTRDAESRDVLDSPVAARISRGTPGRAYARTGATALTALQVARVGGRVRVGPDPRRVSVRLVPTTDLGDAPLDAAVAADDGPTELERLVDACCAAADRLGLGRQRSPWLEPLPPVLTLADLPPGPGLAFGLLDLPAAQARARLALDLDADTHLLVAGAPQSGRTTALRALAGAIAATYSADDLHLYALDFGGGLGCLAQLPHAGAVVQRDQPQRVARVLDRLAADVAQRQAALAAAGHAGLTEQRAATAGPDRLPHLLLMVDRWEALVATFQDVDGGRVVDLLYRLLREGPAVGLHVVVTADRSGVVGRLASMIDRRVLLRLAEQGDYAAAGLPARLVPAELPPGRGWLLGSPPRLAQVALLDPNPAGPAQVTALTLLAAAIPPARHRRPRRVELLPAAVRLSELPPASGTKVAVGVGGDELEPVVVDLADGGLLIGGPPGSGRSSALLAVARQVDLPVVAVAPRPSPLRELPGCVTDPADVGRLAALLGRGPVALLVDDAELLVDAPLGRLLEQAVRQARDGGSVVVAAGTTDDLVTGYRGFVVDLRRARSGVLLSPQSAADGDLLGVRLARPLSTDVRPGRGLLARRGRVEPLQLALA